MQSAHSLKFYHITLEAYSISENPIKELH